MRINEDFLDDEQQRNEMTVDDVQIDAPSGDYIIFVTLAPDDDEARVRRFEHRLTSVMKHFKEVSICESIAESSCNVVKVTFDAKFMRPKRAYIFLKRIIDSLFPILNIFQSSSYMIEVRDDINRIAPKNMIFSLHKMLSGNGAEIADVLRDEQQRCYDWMSFSMQRILPEFPLNFITREIIKETILVNLMSSELTSANSYSDARTGTKLKTLEGLPLDLDIRHSKWIYDRAAVKIFYVEDRDVTEAARFWKGFREDNDGDYEKRLLQNIHSPKAQFIDFLASDHGSPQQRQYTFSCYLGTVMPSSISDTSIHVFLNVKTRWQDRSKKDPHAQDDFIKVLNVLLMNKLDDEAIKLIKWAGRTK